jgi:hypothetical protein
LLVVVVVVVLEATVEMVALSAVVVAVEGDLALEREDWELHHITLEPLLDLEQQGAR